MKAAVAILLLTIAPVACAPRAARPSNEIPAMSEQWSAAFNAGDIDALTAMYTHDARVLPPNAPIAQGHGAIAASFREMTEAGLRTTSRSIESVVSGDLGYQVGAYTIHAPDGTVVDVGKFIEIWRRVDGSWKITHDMFSSDRPAAK